LEIKEVCIYTTGVRIYKIGVKTPKFWETKENFAD